jgi:hypothetical protein
MANEQKASNSSPSPADIEVIDGIAWYRGSRPFDELELPPVPKEVEEDYFWAQQDPAVLKAYGGLVVAVHRRKVWGAGKNYRTAVEDALQKPGCPPAGELVLVLI